MSSIRRAWFMDQPWRGLQQLPLAWSGVPSHELADWVRLRPVHGELVMLTPGGWACVLARSCVLRSHSGCLLSPVIHNLGQ